MKKYKVGYCISGYAEITENEKVIICKTKEWNGKIINMQARHKKSDRKFEKIDGNWIDKTFIIIPEYTTTDGRYYPEHKLYNNVCF